jgi:tetratricopeptide (TPR) repeat protein/nitroreductase
VSTLGVARGSGGSGGHKGTILVAADARDRRLYEGLAARGYRLLGFPAGHAGLVAAAGLPIEPVDFLHTAEPRARQRAQQIAAAVLPQLEAAVRGPGFASFAGLTDRRQRRAACDLAMHYARAYLVEAATAVEAFELVASREDLRLVLVRDEAHPATALLLAARQRGIPTLHLMHGVPYARTVAAHVRADVVAVYGEWTSEWFRRFGAPAERIAITGNPAWDGYREAALLTDRRSIRSSLGLDPDRPVVMFASTAISNQQAADFLYPDWPWQHYEVAMQALGQVHRRRPLQVIVKIHPVEREPAIVNRYRAVAQAAGVPHIVQGGWADARHIYACDLVMCVDSNIGIEAMLLDRPVISVRLGQLFLDYLYSAQDGVLVVEDGETLSDAIEAALGDTPTQCGLAERRASALYRFNYLNDGRAFDRTLTLVDMLLDAGEAERRIRAGAAAPLTAAMTVVQRASVGRQHLQQAQRELEQGRLDTAAYLIERARPFLDAPGGAHFLQGCVALQRGRPDAALAAFQDAVAAEAGNPIFYNGLASALHALERMGEAEAALRRAVALDGDHVDAVVNLAELLLEQGRRAEARPLLERARALAPEDAQVRALWDEARA